MTRAIVNDVHSRLNETAVDETAEPAALRRAMIASTQQLQAMCPVDPYYGRRLLDDVDTLGLADVEAEGRCPVVRGGSPPAAHFLLLTMDKLRDTIIANGAVSEQDYADAVAALQNPP